MEFQELVKNTIKELFEDGSINIYVDIEKDYDGKYISTQVYIDNEKVFENKERLY